MEKAIVVLGNGFDLDLGWKTSYGDFFDMERKSFYNYGGYYVEEMCEGQHWFDLEGFLRKCVEDLQEKKVEELNAFWLKCVSCLCDFFRNSQIVYQTNKESCAYSFLQNLSMIPVFSFNYTNPFVNTGVDEPLLGIQHMHGNLGNISNSFRPKLGIDSFVKNELAKRPEITPLLKAYNNDKKDLLLDAMKHAETIVFYGLSLGITDSDYFKAFFKNMENNRVQGKRIYFVTYNAISFQSIKDNMAQYGINYDDVFFSNNEIKRIFTEKGKEDKDFLEMVDYITSVS